MLDFSFNNQSGSGPRKDFFENIIRVSLRQLGLEKTAVGLSLNIVSDKTMHRLNRDYRAKDQTTDVLSFPLQKQIIAGKKRLTGVILELGDIFIGLERAKRQLAFLTVHGLLHLLGFEHEKSLKQARRMSRLENKILKELNYGKTANSLRN